MDYYVARRLRQVLTVAVVLAAAGWVWWSFFWDAIPVPDLPDLPDVPGLSSRDPSDTAAPAAARGTADANPPLYKWKDAQGRWNITDTPPKDRPFEKIVVNPDTNVIPSMAPAADEEKRGEE